jgi:hypothetical protein
LRSKELAGAPRLQKSLMGQTFNLWGRREFKEAVEFGMINYCSKVVGTAAKLATMMILDELGKSSKSN